MHYTVEFLPGAEREFLKLIPEIRSRVLAAIKQLGQNPRPPGCKKLKGKPSLYRIRVGDYRIIYTIDDGILRVLVVEVGHRGGIYG